MNQIFLVDDEYLAIEGLRLLVNWEELGAQVCGVAYDGQKALEQILQLKPDVVLTDIRMPGMDGLDLIAAVKNVLPDTIFVVVSGYNEFEYARTALRLGVIDYVDKPVTVEKIAEVYQKIKKILNAREQLINEPQKQKQFSLAIGELLHFPKQIPQVLSAVQGKYQVDFNGLKSFLLAECKPSVIDAEKLLQKYWEENFPEIKAVTELYSKEETTVLFVMFCEKVPDDFMKKFKDFGQQLVLDGIVEAIGTSEIHSGIEEFEYALKDGEQALRYAEYFDEPFVEIKELQYQTTPPVQLLNGTNNIVYSFRTGEYDHALEKVDELLTLLLDSELALDLFYSECLKLIHLGMVLCQETGREFERNGETFLPHVEIRQYNRAADIADWVFSVYQDMVQWMKNSKEKEERKVSAAKEYIDTHYNEMMTLPYLASLCKMQPTYFSMLFKEQVGQTYIKYINYVRMDHAKRLLAEGMKVKDIALNVGFQNYRYFCDKFKSLNGCTPEQYRNRLE